MSRSSAFGQTDGASHGPAALAPAGAIQAHGLLLVVREPLLRVVQASGNAGPLLQRPLETLLLATLRDLNGDLDLRVRELLASGSLHNAFEPQPLRCTLGTGPTARAFEGAVHRVAPDALVLELEPRAPAVPAADDPHAAPALLRRLSSAVQAFSEAATVGALADTAARCLQALLGYERTLVCQFADAGGQAIVIAESHNSKPPRLPALRGLQALDADTSAPARHLALQQRVRVLADLGAAPAALLPFLAPGSGGEFDLSRSFLAAAPEHQAQALQAQGIRATLTVALVREGRLWGLLCGHHPQAKTLRHDQRAAVELLTEVFTTRVTAIENYTRTQQAAELRRLQQRLIAATSAEGDWRGALFRDRRSLLQPLAASAAVLCHEGETLSCGEVPQPDALQALLGWLDSRTTAGQPFACHTLGVENPPLAALHGLGGSACGVLAVKLSATQPDLLLWLRREHADGGCAQPWSGADIALATAFGHTLVDMILQVNAVRLLIAQSQLAQVRATVAGSQEAVVVVDAAQLGCYANPAFHTLAGSSPGVFHRLDDLAALFTEPGRAQQMLGQVRAEQRAWRGELVVRKPDGCTVPVALRAEPVPARGRAMLGYIFIFNDLRPAQRAEAARQHLELALTQAGRTALPANTQQGQELVGAIVANASLAAMDITDAGAAPAVVALLEEVQASTARATVLLDHIRRFSDSTP